MEHRKKVILSPLDSADDLIKIEFMKGELAGLDLMLKLPQLIIDDAKDLLETENHVNEV